MRWEWEEGGGVIRIITTQSNWYFLSLFSLSMTLIYEICWNAPHTVAKCQKSRIPLSDIAIYINHWRRSNTHPHTPWYYILWCLEKNGSFVCKNVHTLVDEGINRNFQHDGIILGSNKMAKITMLKITNIFEPNQLDFGFI